MVSWHPRILDFRCAGRITSYNVCYTKLLREIAEKNNCLLFCDEMYRFLEFNPEDRLPSACELYKNAVTLCGLSKSFAMPGARCGWMITKNRELMEEFKTYKDYTTICRNNFV